jgi:hypothetical protein
VQGIVSQAESVVATTGVPQAVWTQSRHTMRQLTAEQFPVRWDKESQLDEVS